MCFSATASFVAAGVTGIVGAAALSRASEPREVPLAAVPVFFSLQQAIEGLLWLALPTAPDGPIAAGLILLFLLFADVFWPVFMPVAVWLIEPSERRRRLILVCLVIGIGVAVNLLWSIVTQPYGAVIHEGHIAYDVEYRPSVFLAAAYLSATALPLLLSSQRSVIALGAVIAVGSSVAFAFYWEAFVSVWCFFAAVASVVILGHFEHARRQRLRTASA